MKTCNKCGNILKDDQAFCNKCGEKWIDVEAIKKAEQDKINQEKEAAERKKAEKDAKMKAKQDAAQEKFKKMKEDWLKTIAENKAKREERRITRTTQGGSGLIKEKRGLQLDKAKKIITIVYLVFSAIGVIAIASSNPEFPASSKDISIERASNFFGPFICFLVPALIILIKPLRKYIPLFKKEKFIFNIIGWVLFFVIGLTVSSIIDSTHSEAFNVEKEKYNIELQLQNEVEAQAKADEEAREKSEAAAQAQTKMYAEFTEEAIALITPSPTVNFTEEAIALITPSPTVDPSINAIIEATGISYAEAENAFIIIKSVGFTKVSKLEFLTEIKGMRAYDADLGYTNNYLVTFTNNEIFGISRDINLTLYDRDAGGVLDQITNYTLDITEKGTYMYLAENHVKQTLKSPSTAKFPGAVFGQDQWIVTRNKDVISVRSWVDAQNSFGAMIRSNFLAQYSYSTQELLYLKVADNVAYGNLH